MTLLTNTDLDNIIIDTIGSESDNQLIITPFERENLTPVGYDLRIGNSYIIDGNEEKLSAGNKLKIKPKKMALILTLEEIRMPRNKTLSAIIQSKVSLSCKGLSNISTTVDADWKGTLLISVHNNSNKTISIEHGDAFCTILFIENKSAAKDGKYAKADGRTDILKELFKKSNSINPIITVLINLIPPLLSVFSLYIASLLFDTQPYMIAATVAVGVGISNYITKFVDPVIEWIKDKK